MKPSHRNVTRVIAKAQKRAQGKPAISKYARKNGIGVAEPVNETLPEDYKARLEAHFKGDA